MDDDRSGFVQISGSWDRYNSVESQTIATGLSAGRHVLSCEVMEITYDANGGTEFRELSRIETGGVGGS